MLLPVGDNLERPNFPLATVMLIFINVAAFVITSKMEMTGSNLIDTGERSQIEKVEQVKEFYGTWGCVPARLQNGEIIGLITHKFLHADIIHLIGNMIILWVFGQSLETALGGFAFVSLYVFWGVVACVTHAAMDFQSEMFLIGASGAIAGVMGGYMTLFGFAARIKMFLLIGPMPFTFFIPACVFGFFWIMQQMYAASVDVEGSLSGVAWMAHVGGFMIGLASIWMFRNQTDQVLVRQGDRCFFANRNEVFQGAAEDSRDIDLDDESTCIEIQSRSCNYCGTTIDRNCQIGERLLRCPNTDCNQLSYLTDDDLRPSYVE